MHRFNIDRLWSIEIIWSEHFCHGEFNTLPERPRVHCLTNQDLTMEGRLQSKLGVKSSDDYAQETQDHSWTYSAMQNSIQGTLPILSSLAALRENGVLTH